MAGAEQSPASSAAAPMVRLRVEDFVIRGSSACSQRANLEIGVESMDHRLAIVIVPAESDDPLHASEALLRPFQKIRATPGQDDLPPKFRHMRVGGWFDGLVRGEIGKERWSTVLSMLLSGAPTSAESPLPGYGPETGDEIEARIRAGNSLAVVDIWPQVPCAIVLTPDGEWFEDVSANDIEPGAQADEFRESTAWLALKADLFAKHHGDLAVAWDVSWNFIKPSASGPQGGARSRTRSRQVSAVSREAWAARITAARRTASQRKLLTRAEGKVREDEAALDRWSGEGGYTHRPVGVSSELDVQRTEAPV
jgi:hypothetical protein